jgi:hypothetical protein
MAEVYFDPQCVQAVTLLLILALMRGSVKTSLDALIHLLDPIRKDPTEEKLASAPAQEGSTTPPASDVPAGKGREEALRSVVPYLKQLEDFRKHKELCSLFEEAYQGKAAAHCLLRVCACTVKMRD